MPTAENPFPGFEPLHSNYVYCPNQFFDVCLPHCSRGAVRIVAYMLRETLGWLDAEGNPLQQEICVTYRDLVQKAGVSSGALAAAMSEAIEGGFLKCVQAGRAKKSGMPAQTAVYSLSWSRATECITDHKRFDGFFRGEGYRTPVPNSFFDTVVRNEPLAVTRVVGTVIRHTIGYANQFGGRRSTAPLSHNYIERYANVSRGKAVAAAIRRAIVAGYIQLVSTGTFSATEEKRSAASYGIKWLHGGNDTDNASKSPAEDSERLRNPSSNDSEFPAGHRLKNPSKETTSSKDILKQQPAADIGRKATVTLLIAEGFDQPTAILLTKDSTQEVIQNQVAWIESRNPQTSRIGMLRKSIVENWPQPEAVAVREKQRALRQRDESENVRRLREDAEVTRRKNERGQRRDRLVQEWNVAPFGERSRWLEQAIADERSSAIANIIRRQNSCTEIPHANVLNVIARERELPPVFQSRHNEAR